VLRPACLLAALALAKASLKATCLFRFHSLFWWKAVKSPNKHPLSSVPALQEISDALNYKITNLPITYLALPLIIKKAHKEDFQAELIKSEVSLAA
jgi:hypothetical protein